MDETPTGQGRVRTVLSVGADASAVASVEEELAGSWRVRQVEAGDAQPTAVRERPDALLVSVDGAAIDVCAFVRDLRADFRTAVLPVVALVAGDGGHAETLRQLRESVDDYVSVPWQGGELSERLSWATTRNGDISPMAGTTGLPGLMRARQDLVRRMTAGETYAYCQLDLDGLASFNDVYGYERGDELVFTLAAALRRVVADLSPDPFVAHLGGDDFVLVCAAGQARPACRDVADLFEADSMRLYDQADVERGQLELRDRRGRVHHVPLVSVSAGVATNEHRHFDDPHHVAGIAAEMLTFAKRSRGSSVGVDRRKY